MQLTDLLEFGRIEFSKVISLKANAAVLLAPTRWKLAALSRVSEKFIEVSVQASRTIRLSDKDLFDISIGTRILKNEINKEGRGIPVYSANVYEAFGYTEKTLLQSFDMASVLWGIDGDWMVNHVSQGSHFYPTDHCGVIRIKSDDIHPRYLAIALEEEGRRAEFSRSKRASIRAIEGLKIKLPPFELQKEFAAVMEKAEQDIAVAEASIVSAG